MATNVPGLLNFGGTGLSNFSPFGYGLLSPNQVAQLQASVIPTQGQYGQALPSTPYDPKAEDAKFDPYYNLRNMSLENNPNFSWLKSFNTQPMNFAPLSYIDPTDPQYAQSSSGSGGSGGGISDSLNGLSGGGISDSLNGLSGGKIDARDLIGGLAMEKLIDTSDPHSLYGETTGKLNEFEDNIRQGLALNNESGLVGQVGGKLNEIEDNLRQGVSNVVDDVSLSGARSGVDTVFDAGMDFVGGLLGGSRRSPLERAIATGTPGLTPVGYSKTDIKFDPSSIGMGDNAPAPTFVTMVWDGTQWVSQEPIEQPGNTWDWVG